jgi:hypothetical protein
LSLEKNIGAYKANPAILQGNWMGISSNIAELFKKIFEMKR